MDCTAFYRRLNIGTDVVEILKHEGAKADAHWGRNFVEFKMAANRTILMSYRAEC